MELIDKKALLEMLGRECGGECGICPNELDSTMNYACGLIVNAPTIEAAPVVHGEWIEKPTGAYGKWQSWCSACGKHSGIGGIESNRHKPFCPNCGAKMDGKAV